jgi:hypothetical protein
MKNENYIQSLVEDDNLKQTKLSFKADDQILKLLNSVKRLFVLTSTSINSLVSFSCNLSRWLFILSRKSLISFSMLSFCLLIESAQACLFSRIHLILLEMTVSCCCRSSKEQTVVSIPVRSVSDVMLMLKQTIKTSHSDVRGCCILPNGKMAHTS